MTLAARARDLLNLWPDQADVAAVERMTVRQWRRAATNKPSYLNGYRDRPGSDDRAQKRAEWIASLAVFVGARGVTEVGCACGRNLAVLARRHPGLWLGGVDVSAPALAVAEQTLAALPSARAALAVVDLYDVYWREASTAWIPSADIVLTVGVLGHLHPMAATLVAQRLHDRVARKALVMVEEFGHGEVLKGPRPWHPDKVTDDYALWRVPLPTEATSIERFPVPPTLQAPAAKEVIVWHR